MDLKAEHINLKLLPPVAQDLAAVIGLPATLELIKAYPGIPLYIPAHPHHEHPITAIIGHDKLTKLSNIYGQTYLKMPNLTARKVKHRMVKELQAQGKSIRVTALATGYCARRVEQLRSGEQPSSQQCDLFKGESR